ncbi:haemoglobin type 1 [Plakobranchus ocellatus]|uniref:Globin n=1 Tax=Plakobranchus ocellatus TaxID=259542 RepID=A0AAV4AUJ6_9GAST|nr:haemoglobin type 1 [Plakobranchus ocellatus]
MFDNIPNMRPRFSKFEAQQPRHSLVADEMFLAHTQSVIVALDQVVKLLDNPKKLKQTLSGLVRSHVQRVPPIGSTYFVPFASSFHIFAEAALGVPEDHPEVQAWVKFLHALADMVKAEEVAQGHEAAAAKADLNLQRSSFESQHSDFITLFTSFKSQHSNFIPLFTSFKSQHSDFIPLFTSFKSQHSDFIPLFTSLKSQHSDFIILSANFMSHYTDKSLMCTSFKPKIIGFQTLVFKFQISVFRITTAVFKLQASDIRAPVRTNPMSKHSCKQTQTCPRSDLEGLSSHLLIKLSIPLKIRLN